ncbi:hypothetical protein AVEN_88784-1 [Araneus ventricosus]|uniref:RING-type domain-containing protein n=1 Tax=Araneus ventricosus TaxID=182803 RepID=A0A4Y2I9V1_ARAVE|nr:hypothetical protein AVEN_51877-1 [Araneus ventricosus]GBM74280.1 hypothetical protein AVEN_88784-1 [Araneus ventricosus]
MDREYNHPMSNEEAKGISGDTIQCVICWKTVGSLNRKRLPCSHIFHKKCINKWLKRSSICPICRSSIHGMNNSLTMATTWTRTATWLIKTVSLYIYRIFLYFLNFFLVFNQSNNASERNGRNRRREYAHRTHSHSTSNGNGFIRQRRVMVARRRW